MVKRATSVWFGVICLAGLLAAAGCGEDLEGGPSDVGGLDLGVDTGADVGADAGGETGPDGGRDAGGDVADGGDVGWSFPDPIIAGTQATDPLADDPAHCGQNDYEWLRSGPLGEVTGFGRSMDFSKTALTGIAEQQDLEPPREFEHNVRVEQFSYMTQDRGDMIESTALVGYPKDLEADEPVDVLLVLHGTAGFSDACAPSDSLVGQGLAALFASWGYLVVAPDYIGMKGVGEPTGFLHPYLVGQPTAIASLDSVRALGQLPAQRRGGLKPSNRVLVFGGSQGGHAALWVDRLASYYARELELLGTVATVPPADLLTEGERALDEMVRATGNLIAFLGAAPEWYGHEDRLDEVFESPYDTEVPTALEENCNPGDGFERPDTTDAIFDQNLVESARNGTLEEVSPWGCMAAENSLTDTRIDRLGPDDDSYGILYVLGEKDDLVHTPIERTSFEQLCEEGMPLKYLECEGAGHVDTSFWSLPEILEFFEARQAGEPFEGSTSCGAQPPVTCRGTPSE